MQQVISDYINAFTWDSLVNVFTSTEGLLTIGSLIILEGLLSADNAIVLAIMVKHLPPKERKKALLYGLVGAYVFRFIAIGIGIYLVKFIWVQILGGAYLLYVAISHFWKKNQTVVDKVRPAMGFWKTVLMLQLMDIAFSVDSIIAAFAISREPWILLIGGMLGVLMMRGVAQLFISLIEKVPELEAAAFILIFIIGAKMLAGAFGFHLPKSIFFGLMALVFVGTFVINRYNQKKKKQMIRDKSGKLD